MSHRVPPDRRGFYIHLPADLKLPLYSASSGYCVRDETLGARVQRALLDERVNMPLVKNAARDREWPRVAGVFRALRRAFGSILAFAATFSLGVAAGRY